MMCMGPIIFALSVAIGGDTVETYPWGALRRDGETGAVSVWRWRRLQDVDLICTGPGWAA